MSPTEILALYDRQQRIDIEYPDARKEVLPHVVRFVRPPPRMNFVEYGRDLDESNVDAVIEEQIAYFEPMHQPFEWNVYDHDPPPNLKERLVAHGFQPQEPGALMVLDLEQAPSALLQPVTADVRPITSREQVEDVIRIEEQVWGGNFDWMRERIEAHWQIPGYLSIYVAYVQDEPACAGWTYFNPNSQFAGLYGGSTVARFRQRGLYTSVLAVRVQEAIRRGYRFLTIDASPMSQPIVAKHGFQLLTYTCSFQWKGSEPAESSE